MKTDDVHRLQSTVWVEAASRDPRLGSALRRPDVRGKDAPPNLTREHAELRLGALAWIRAYDTAAHEHLFVIELRDEPALHTIEAPLTAELPPLPFQSCWFDLWDDARRAPAPLARAPWAPLESLVFGYAIHEEEPATKWLVSVVTSDFSGRYDVTALVLRYKNGRLGLDVAGPVREAVAAGREEVGDGLATWALRLPVLLVHLVNIAGARHEPVPQPRSRRRALARNGATPAPVYFVNLRSAGDPDATPREGRSAVVYRHRWVVRGHYRSHESGRYQHPDKGPCVWVPSHVKGPAGAPWKGRAIHHTGGATVARRSEEEAA